MAAVLNACGLRTYHEKFYTPLYPHMAGMAYGEGQFAEVSAAAYGFRSMISGRTAVLHQMRDPVNVINSLRHTSHCLWNPYGEVNSGPNAKKWHRHYWRSINGEAIEWSPSHSKRCEQFYFAYNDAIARHVAATRKGFTYRVEDISVDLIERIFSTVGMKLDRGLANHVIANTGRTINRIGPEPRRLFDWADMEPEHIHSAMRYGYRAERSEP